MAEDQDMSMEEVLSSIRSILWEKEINKNNAQSMLRDYSKEDEMPVFELTKEMLVSGWALPYEYANWNFDDVAAKILHKYAEIFAMEENKSAS